MTVTPGLIEAAAEYVRVRLDGLRPEIAIVLGLAVMGANMLGYLSNEVTSQLLVLIGLAFGAAIGARLTKMHKALKK